MAAGSKSGEPAKSITVISDGRGWPLLACEMEIFLYVMKVLMSASSFEKLSKHWPYFCVTVLLVNMRMLFPLYLPRIYVNIGEYIPLENSAWR